MELKLLRDGDLLVIHVPGPRIDAGLALDFKEAVHGAVTDDDRRIMLDLSEIDFIDSSGLGAVVGVRKLFWPDRPLELAGLTQSVEKVFLLTRMNTVFTIHADPPLKSNDAA